MESQGREYPSLLFTPKPLDKPTDSYRARSPRSTRSPSTPAYGRSGMFREGSVSRRRSLTPTGSVKDTPPPPPVLSLLDSSRGVNPPPPVQEAKGNGTIPLEPPETTSYGEDVDQTWVTVYGFQAEDQYAIVREFAKCGDILHFGCGREDKVNWVHIHFASIHQAQRALLKNGQVLNGRLMIGVKPLESRHRPAALSLTQLGSESSTQSTVKPVFVRSYKLDGAADKGLVPSQTSSTWAKISEFVFGQ